MRRSGPVRRLLRCASVVAVVALVVLGCRLGASNPALTTALYPASCYRRPGPHAVIAQGQFVLSWTARGTLRPGTTVTPRAAPFGSALLTFTGGGWSIWTPMPQVRLAAATLLLSLAWLPARRAPGHCARCGYDLAGTTTGVCPECGAGAGA